MKRHKLNKIAREWSAGILYHGTGMDSFFKDNNISSEDAGVIVEEVHRIGLRINGGRVPDTELKNIVKKNL